MSAGRSHSSQDVGAEDHSLDWIEPGAFLRTNVVMCLLGWPLLAFAAVVADVLSSAAAVVVGGIAMLSAWDLHRSGRRSASRAIALCVLCSLAPVMMLAALLAGAGLSPSRWLATTLGLYGLAVIGTVASAAVIVRRPHLPAMARLIVGKPAVRLARRPLPGLTLLIAIGVAAVISLWLFGQMDAVRIVAAASMACLLGMLAYGPAAQWLATAWMLRQLERNERRAIRLA